MQLLKKVLPVIVFLAVASVAVTLYACLHQPEINAASPGARTPEISAPKTPPATPSATEPSAPEFLTELPTSKRDGDFTLIKAQGFDKDAPLGSFEQVYGGKLTGYNGFFDHANRGPGLYAPIRVLSAKAGVLTYNLHTENGTPLVAALTPTGYKGQKYGRWVVRFRVEDAPGYRAAFLLWPDGQTETRELWEKGEIDFPEVDLKPEGSVNGFSHDTTGNPKFNPMRFISGERASQWRTAAIEWTPEYVKFSLDGRSYVSEDPRAIPRDPMHWVLQTQVESALGVKPEANVSGKVQIDWFAQYRWTPQGG